MAPPEPYLTQLTVRLIEGLERIDPETREKHIVFLRAQQRPDGGFPGREGGSDLYYTGFALRGLAVMQALTPELCERAGAFLLTKLNAPAGIVDFFSLLVSCYLVPLGGGPDVLATAPDDWKDRVATMLAGFRTTDGGYGKATGAPAGSTYTSFLLALAFQLLDRPIPNPTELAAFVRSRSREDGGYVEIKQMKRSGTNPTAAGVGVLQITDSLTVDETTKVIQFMAALKSPFEGGLRANDRIPAADLLSTFTAAWTLDQLGAINEVDLSAIRGYAESNELPRGGFRGGLWDDTPDVEYTFYGLGVLALAALHGK